jgi:hypothetical protein
MKKINLIFGILDLFSVISLILQSVEVLMGILKKAVSNKINISSQPEKKATNRKKCLSECLTVGWMK